MAGFSDSGIFVVTASIGSVSASINVGAQVAVNNQQGMPALSTGVAAAPAATQLDTFPFTLSLTGSLSASNYQSLPLKSDFQGNLANREQFAPVAEDNFNGVIAVTKLPTIASVYAWSVVASTSALVSASQVKTTAGVVRSIWGRLDASAASGNYWVHVYNAVTGVAAGVAGPDLIAPLKLAHVNGTDNAFNIDLTSEGVFFSAGLQVAMGTTQEFTYTATGAVMNVTTLFK